MRSSYAFIAIGVVAILLSTYALNQRFTKDEGTMGPSVTSSTFQLTSSAFEKGGTIPSRFTCDADNTPPPLSIGGVPEGAKSLALIMEDPDVPKQLKPDGVFLHWVLFNIPATANEIGPTGSIGMSGMNGAGKEGYVGPCPPKEYEPSEHRYIFKLYALDAELSLESGATRDEVVQAMEGHILGEAELSGKYKRQ